MKPIIACGTSEGENLFEDHFDDAPYFHLYETNFHGFEFMEEVENIALEKPGNQEPEEELKAKKISALLKAKSVNVLLAHQMGPQIAKITKNFVPVISRELNIKTALDSVSNKLHLIEREWRKGDSREYLVLEKS